MKLATIEKEANSTVRLALRRAKFNSPYPTAPRQPIP